MERLDFLLEAIGRVESAETLAPAGSHEHGRYVAAALMIAWPTIKAYAAAERYARKYPHAVPGQASPDWAP